MKATQAEREGRVASKDTDEDAEVESNWNKGWKREKRASESGSGRSEEDSPQTEEEGIRQNRSAVAIGQSPPALTLNRVRCWGVGFFCVLSCQLAICHSERSDAAANQSR